MRELGYMDEVDGRLVQLERKDLNQVLAGDGVKGHLRYDEEWNDIAFHFWDGAEGCILHIHELEDDDTDYLEEDAPAGMIYYSIYRFTNGEWEEDDGGVIGYELGDTLGDWLESTLGLTAEDVCN